MVKKNEKIYSVKEIRTELEQYLDLSVERLRARFKNVWKQQTDTRKSIYHAEVKV